MNTILNLFTPEAIEITLKGNQDPVPSFIDKLSSGENLKIKIQTSTDNILIQNKKNLTALQFHMKELKKTFNSQNLKNDFLCSLTDVPQIFPQENKNLYCLS